VQKIGYEQGLISDQSIVSIHDTRNAGVLE